MQLSKRIMAATFCLIVMLSLAISQSAIGENSGEALTVGVPIDRCPVFYLDAATGEITGIGVDLMRSAAENSGHWITILMILLCPLAAPLPVVLGISLSFQTT